MSEKWQKRTSSSAFELRYNENTRIIAAHVLGDLINEKGYRRVHWHICLGLYRVKLTHPMAEVGNG
jgi:hypothetical protein